MSCSTLRAILVGSAIALFAVVSAPSAIARTTPTHSTATFPISTFTTNPCNGESVDLEGTFHVEQTTLADSGNGFHDELTFLYTVTGVGVFGNAYTSTNVGHGSVYSATFPIVSTQVINSIVISKGSAPNFFLRTVEHTTVNANGDISSQVVHVSPGCTGA